MNITIHLEGEIIASCLIADEADTRVVIVNELFGDCADAGVDGLEAGCGSSNPANLMTTPEEALTSAVYSMAAPE